MVVNFIRWTPWEAAWTPLKQFGAWGSSKVGGTWAQGRIGENLGASLPYAPDSEGKERLVLM